MEKFYLDKNEIIEADGPTSIYIAGAEMIDAGVTISSMPVEYKDDECQSYADNYDIHFIFDDVVPRVDFFTIPLVDIFATDSNGGYLGTVGETTDFQNEAQICYIDTVYGKRDSHFRASGWDEHECGCGSPHLDPSKNRILRQQHS